MNYATSRLSVFSLITILLVGIALLTGCNTAPKTDVPPTSSSTASTTATTEGEEPSTATDDSSHTVPTIPSKNMVAMLTEEWNQQLKAQYGTSLPDSYAGAFDNTTELVIYVTDEAAQETFHSLLTDETIHDIEAKWLSSTGESAEKWADHTWVRYLPAAYSLNELQALKNQLNENAAEWKIVSITVDVEANRLAVELDGSYETKADILAALDERETDMVTFSLRSNA